MTPSTPLITIGLPVYNGESFLGDAFDSLLQQTEERFEIVVVDNGSTDGTAAIVDAYAGADDRIRVERSPSNRGAAWSHNRTVELARGAYFRWAAADDRSNAAYLEACLQALQRDHRAVLAYPGVRFIDGRGAELRPTRSLTGAGGPDPIRRFREMALTPHGCFQVYGLVRTEVLRRTALIGPYTSSDRVLLAELALAGPFVAADGAVLDHREHEENSLKQHRDLRERAAWFDPANAGRRVRPVIEVGRELRRAVARARLTPLQRIAGSSVAAAFLWSRRRQTLGELVPARGRAALYRLRVHLMGSGVRGRSGA